MATTKTKRGRPAKSKKELRVQPIMVYCTAQEHQEIKAAAKAVGRPMSHFLIIRAIGHRVP